MNEPKTNYLEPDPAWDYYEVWNTLLSAKKAIDNALELMKTQEHANPDCDVEIQEYITQVEMILETIDLDLDDA